MSRTIALFIEKSKFFLLVFGIMILLTPCLLRYPTGLSWGPCVRTTVGIAMGDSPTSFEELLSEENINLANKSIYTAWLFFLRFFGWLIVPILVGAIVSETQKQIETQRARERALEARLRQAKEDIQEHTRQELADLGLDSTSIDILTSDMLDPLDDLFADDTTSERDQGRVGQVIEGIKQYFR